MIGATALDSPNGHSPTAWYFTAEKVDRMFERGGLLLDAGNYKLDAGRRTEPGGAERHAAVTDIMRIVEGTATVITGGTMVEPRTVEDGETRSATIDGGVRHQLSAGDVLAIPAGVPHQFVEVSDPFLYFVVKVEG